ncbi:hypothetical protein ASPBRDRAFT_198938 [Aspergillus brasiliensis CBS 101740]|uniref:Uncharacterized protein n=1 Tax=Aspergillus brasiliensis (strain CBS 101740 / IMI 381727 / IBT 21946) TaxID=767769 RepID=A0A1L9UAB1_ASPBC|nr:hypothetical protein ASPBRDRAFT_198938 [Aspergillus brasiliensis CBS 101740]
MSVSYTSDTDDQFITGAGVSYEFPPAVPTSMSASIARIEFASLCEETVNQLPVSGLDPKECGYGAVLGLGARFQNYLKDLSVFFQPDLTSIRQSQAICEERPYIA